MQEIDPRILTCLLPNLHCSRCVPASSLTGQFWLGPLDQFENVLWAQCLNNTALILTKTHKALHHVKLAII